MRIFKFYIQDNYVNIKNNCVNMQKKPPKPKPKTVHVYQQAK